MPQAPQLIPACPTFSNLLLVLTHNTKNDYTKHTTPNNTLTIHSKNTMCHNSLNSKNLPSLSLSVSPPPSLTQLSLILNNQTCCLDTFITKACFYNFFLHQTQSKRDSNVREKVWRTLFTSSLVLDMLVRPVRRLGRWAVWVS